MYNTDDYSHLRNMQEKSELSSMMRNYIQKRSQLMSEIYKHTQERSLMDPRTVKGARSKLWLRIQKLRRERSFISSKKNKYKQKYARKHLQLPFKQEQSKQSVKILKRSQKHPDNASNTKEYILQQSEQASKFQTHVDKQSKLQHRSKWSFNIPKRVHERLKQDFKYVHQRSEQGSKFQNSVEKQSKVSSNTQKQLQHRSEFSFKNPKYFQKQSNQASKSRTYVPERAKHVPKQSNQSSKKRIRATKTCTKTIKSGVKDTYQITQSVYKNNQIRRQRLVPERLKHEQKQSNQASKTRAYVLHRPKSSYIETSREDRKWAKDVTEGSLERHSFRKIGPRYQDNIHIDILRIPEPIPKGQLRTIHLNLISRKPTWIVFDLETTGLRVPGNKLASMRFSPGGVALSVSKNKFSLFLVECGIYPHITQISAKAVSSDETFNQYVLPKEPIGTMAQLLNGIRMEGDSMTVKGHQVQAVPVRKGLKRFFTWLGKFSNVVLIAHNGRRFDFPVLIKPLACVGKLEVFFKYVTGLVDSLPVFRKRYPGMSSYKQTNLAWNILNLQYSAHNAHEDVEALGKLIDHTLTTMSMEDLMAFGHTPKSYHNVQVFRYARNDNIYSLCVLVDSGVCTKYIADNIAGSGLNIHHLRKIFHDDGEDGLRNAFVQENSANKPRVTKCRRVLQAVIPKLAEYFNNEHNIDA